MVRTFVFSLTALTVLSADDPWAKVSELRSGTEIRFFRKNAKQPVAAKFDEATPERLVVVVKNEQVAIPRDEIDRIDARPARSGRVRPESTVTTKGPGEPDAHRSGPPSAYPGSSTSTSTGVSIGKPDFETIYRRTAGPPKK